MHQVETESFFKKQERKMDIKAEINREEIKIKSSKNKEKERDIKGVKAL